MSTTTNGASPDPRGLKRRTVAAAARVIAPAAALLMLASVAIAGDTTSEDRPIRATEVSSMISSAPPGSAAAAPDSAVPPRPASLPPEMPSRPTFTTPAVPAIDNSVAAPGSTSPAEAQEIPQAQPDQTSANANAPGAPPVSADANSYTIDDPDLINGLGSVRDFVAEGQETSTMGFDVRESSCRLKSGEQTDGLLIVNVAKGSPAEKAGLRSYNGKKHHMFQALAIGAGMAFPPAMLLTMVALPMIEYTEAGKSYDMIIGIDGIRVNNFFDFEERMRTIEPGELVYFNLVRNGKRIQVAVPIPALSASASN